ncbi:MAG: ATP-binding cassette domain-containing protein [Cytophagaceae bacterium]|nr:ATP-binding cassette domain-containing protein [Cytophagaceae bacterium]
MRLSLQNIGKKFDREWIFRNLTLDLRAGQRLAVTGPNGSGKSTLLQVLSGAVPTNEGILTHFLAEIPLEADVVYRQVALAAPYLELIEEFTLDELLRFHIRFKPLRKGLSVDQFADLLELSHARQKPIRYFSSGMKQRVKLGLALYSEARLVLLDEPTANLDRRGVAWYQHHVQQLPADVLLLIASNQPEEYAFCPEILNIPDYKPVRF